MKKFLKAALALALVATMMVAAIVTVNAEENLAPSASYTITRLAASFGSDDEGKPAYLGEGRGDDVGFTRLNDGKAVVGESETLSVCLAGTARTHRITFDLGSAKEVSKVVLKSLIDTYRREYDGNPAGNRGFNKDDIRVYSDKNAKKAISASISEAEVLDSEGNSKDCYDVTLSFDKVTTQYITIELQAAQAGQYYASGKGSYIVTINEVEIYGGDASAEPADNTQADNTDATDAPAAETTAKPATTKASGTAKAGDSSIALIAIVSLVSLAGAVVVLKKRSF